MKKQEVKFNLLLFFYWMKKQPRTQEMTKQEVKFNFLLDEKKKKKTLERT